MEARCTGEGGWITTPSSGTYTTGVQQLVALCTPLYTRAMATEQAQEHRPAPGQPLMAQLPPIKGKAGGVAGAARPARRGPVTSCPGRRPPLASGCAYAERARVTPTPCAWRAGLWCSAAAARPPAPPAPAGARAVREPAAWCSVCLGGGFVYGGRNAPPRSRPPRPPPRRGWSGRERAAGGRQPGRRPRPQGHRPKAKQAANWQAWAIKLANATSNSTVMWQGTEVAPRGAGQQRLQRGCAGAPHQRPGQVHRKQVQPRGPARRVPRVAKAIAATGYRGGGDAGHLREAERRRADGRARLAAGYVRQPSPGPVSAAIAWWPRYWRAWLAGAAGLSPAILPPARACKDASGPGLEAAAPPLPAHGATPHWSCGLHLAKRPSLARRRRRSQPRPTPGPPPPPPGPTPGPPATPPGAPVCCRPGRRRRNIRQRLGRGCSARQRGNRGAARLVSRPAVNKTLPGCVQLRILRAWQPPTRPTAPPARFGQPVHLRLVRPPPRRPATRHSQHRGAQQ